jgi:hypothetical protein
VRLRTSPHQLVASSPSGPSTLTKDTNRIRFSSNIFSLHDANNS